MTNMNGASRTFNAANQLTNDGTNTLSFDENGNLTSDGVNAYNWDRANRLLSMGGSSYAYDGNGNRVSQTISSVVTEYLLDIQPGLAVVLSDDDGTNTNHYIHALHGVHAQYDATDWQWLVQDGLGSVRGVVNDDNTVAQSLSYTEYGVPDSSIEGFAFTGEPRDANGLQYHRARYYAPEMGVWASLDPLDLANRYGYVSNNPVNWVDPLGLFDVSQFCREAAMADGPWPFGEGACIFAVFGSLFAGAYAAGLAASNLDPQIISRMLYRYPDVPVREDETSTDTGVTPAAHPAYNPNYRLNPTPTFMPVPLPQPTTTPNPTLTATATATQEPDCPTNDAPGSDAPFDTTREMEDIMCNVRKHTAPSGPQPAHWWKSLQGRVTPLIGNWIGLFGGGAFVGRNPIEYRDFFTRIPVTGNRGSLFLLRPGNLFGKITRADIMAVAVHELRHAGQYYSLFSEERFKGQLLHCHNISGRMGESDAWLTSNHWVLNAITVGKLRDSDFKHITPRGFLNRGMLWTEDSVWTDPIIMEYEARMGKKLFHEPPYYFCPQSTQSLVSASCINPMAIRHL